MKKILPLFLAAAMAACAAPIQPVSNPLFSGQNATTVTAAATSALNVTLFSLTRALAANEQESFSATPTVNASLAVTYTADSTARTVTFAVTVYSYARAADISSSGFVVPANATIKVVYFYSIARSRWEVMGDPPLTTGTGPYVLQTSPTLITPILGAAAATSINGNTLTTGTWTLTGAASKTLTFNNTITLAGTDGTTMTFPSTSATIARTDAANTFIGTQTFGALVATTLNGNTFTTGTGTLTIAASKTLSISNTLTLAGTDSTTMTFPATSATLARTDALNAFTGASTTTSWANTTQVVTGGLTASGSGANDFSGSTGTFLTSTGANTNRGSSVSFGPTAASSGSFFDIKSTFNAGPGTAYAINLRPTITSTNAGGDAMQALHIAPTYATGTNSNIEINQIEIRTPILTGSANVIDNAGIYIFSQAISGSLSYGIYQAGTTTPNVFLGGLQNTEVVARITTITSSATPAVDVGVTDCVTITAQAAAITSMSSGLSGTPKNFQQLEYRIKDDGTARAITPGASFVAGPAALPTTTTVSKCLHIFFEYDSVQAKWVCMSIGSDA